MREKEYRFSDTNYVAFLIMKQKFDKVVREDGKVYFYFTNTQDNFNDLRSEYDNCSSINLNEYNKSRKYVIKLVKTVA